MTETATQPGVAMARTPQERSAVDKRVDGHVAYMREQNAMVTQIRGTQWGLGIDSRIAKAVSNYCLEAGLDPVRHVEVLGGRLYLTAGFYEERAAPLIRSGEIVPHEPEFINVDPRLDQLIADEDADTAAWARKEKARRARARIEHNVPEEAVSTCVKRLTIAATGQTVVGVNWCGGGTRKKMINDRNTGEKKLIDSDPIGDLEPTKTSITRAARRAWKQVADVVIAYGRQIRPIEQRAEALNVEIERVETEKVPAPAQLNAGAPEPAAPEAAAPSTPSDTELSLARSMTVPGQPDAWGGYGGKRLDECRNSLLKAIGKWCIEQGIDPHGFAGSEALRHAAGVVYRARKAGVLEEPAKIVKADPPAPEKVEEPIAARAVEPVAAAAAVNPNDGLPGADDELPF